jgi:hypothetical protein
MIELKSVEFERWIYLVVGGAVVEVRVGFYWRGVCWLVCGLVFVACARNYVI